MYQLFLLSEYLINGIGIIMDLQLSFTLFSPIW